MPYWPNLFATTIVIVITTVPFICEIGAQNLEKSRSVWVEQGLLRGKIYKIGEKFMQIFRGIPYAEPPVGSLRFQVITIFIIFYFFVIVFKFLTIISKFLQF